MSGVHQVRRLRIRPGPGARGAARGRVLTEVARSLLGDEIDEALSGLVGDADDLEIAHLTVRLEVDPTEADERTLAALWAGLIRAEVVRALAKAADREQVVLGEAAAPVAESEAEDPEAPATRVTDLADVLMALLAGRPVGAADLRAVAVRAHDDEVIVEALALLPLTQRRAALDLIGAAGIAPTPAALRALDPAARTDDADAPPPAGRGTHDTDVRRSRGTGRRSPAVRTSTHDPGADPRGRADERSYPTTGPALSAYGGLVLLHHRLRPLLEHACAVAPHADPLAVRREVLAALARPMPAPDDLRQVLDDPLVRLLAGDPGWLDRPAPPPAGIEVDQQAADDVLRAFAGDLPGFATSTPDFVRREWVDRRAVLVPDREPGHEAVLLRLGPRPLDLMLDRLPYPIGAFRLPWTSTLLVGWEGE